MTSFTQEEAASRLETVFQMTENFQRTEDFQIQMTENFQRTEDFQMTEDFISQQRDQGNKRGRKRKAGEGVVLFTAEWREAAIRFAQNLPMDLLIQEFNRFYQNVRNQKRISVGRTSGKNSKALPGQKENQKDYSSSQKENQKVIYLPADIMEIILSRLQPADVVVSRSISPDWSAVYASKDFQDTHNLREKCIVVNNNNLDMWAFSVISKRWFLMKVPCDWDTLGMKTLGVKAGCSGLFLVARSDLSLFVVNPLTSHYKSLPTIRGINFIKSLIFHGAAEMIVDDEETGRYRVFLFGNCHEEGNSCVHVAQYDSTTEIWKVDKVYLIGFQLSSAKFPRPLRSYRVDNVITCFSATGQFFSYSWDVSRRDVGLHPRALRLPAGIEFRNPYGEGHHKATFPTLVPCIPGQWALIGRLEGCSGVEEVYGRLPIVAHSTLGVWKISPFTGQWELFDVIPIEFMQSMVESSEGTDFVVVGDGSDVIWLMLRGSRYMLEYRVSTGFMQLQPGCPGGGYMDANFHWKAVFQDLGFYIPV